ncbi:amidohydrolase [Jatrophihabitans telluris]|uniref:Amidohydrolase n=1 Tax=Jatrophihabitans telluris TaxID=2038343 RepID=A0ABY4R178_9ACTN|nr:amidohydrolase family protein [Jatrophihabitans telluris]UQX89513.1 amidohydrolase [Jatrophihabitans telluris]
MLTDEQVPDVWRALGLPGLADVHVHFLPPRMLDKVWHFFDEADKHYGLPWPIHYKRSEDERIALLAGFGVTRFPTLAYPHKPGMAAWLNDWCAGFAAKHPQAVHSATFFAEPGAERYVAGAVESGAKIFKVHVQVGEFDPSDDVLDPVWGLLADAGIPVVVHCGSGPLPGRFTGPGPIEVVLARHRKLAAVIAHAGAPEYAEHLALAERYPNVRLDTTMVGTPYLSRFAPVPADVIARYRELPHKLVLGTDFPNIPYSYAQQIQSLLEWECGDDWLRQVLWHNGAELLGLTGAGEHPDQDEKESE